jgi:hypothetical protein
MGTRCQHCQDYGYCQVYTGRVIRVFCDCPVGDKRIESHKDALREVGLDPEDPSFTWRRRSQCLPRYG